jgi:hypothetical protein
MQDLSAPRVARIFGIPVHEVSRPALVSAIDDNIRGARARCYISITSSELPYNCAATSSHPSSRVRAPRRQCQRFDRDGSVWAEDPAFPGPELMESL